GGSAAQTCDGFTIPADHPDHAAYDAATVAGVVTDAVTGLTWQRATIADDPSWRGAAGHCAGLTLGGASSGWRVPDINELASIVDFAVAGPAIDRTAFPSTPSTYFVTSTGVYLHGQRVGGTDGHTIDFQTGVTINGMPTFGSVRCVRSAIPRRCYASDARFAALSSCGVDADVDAATTLTWQKSVARDPLAWPDARACCTTLGGGFRLPGAKELLTIVDWKAVGVAIDKSAFPGTPTGPFWTSSQVAGSTRDAGIVDFTTSDSARSGNAPIDTAQNVRCVR